MLSMKKPKRYPTSELREFIRESNQIEDEHSSAGVEDGVEALFAATALLASRGAITPIGVLEVHGHAMKRVRFDIAGKFRTCDVMVGLRLCPSWGLVRALLHELCKKQPKTEEEIRQWHIEFEKIHPFEDGNGRVGRIILCAQRLSLGLPVEIIRADTKHTDYYPWFE